MFLFWLCFNLCSRCQFISSVFFFNLLGKYFTLKLSKVYEFKIKVITTDDLGHYLNDSLFFIVDWIWMKFTMYRFFCNLEIQLLKRFWTITNDKSSFPWQSGCWLLCMKLINPILKLSIVLFLRICWHFIQYLKAHCECKGK